MKFLLCFSVIFTSCFLSCTKDKSIVKKAPEVPVSLGYCDSMKVNGIVSWKCDIDTIIKTYCALSSCHNNNPDFGVSQPNFTGYNEVFSFRSRIRERATVVKDMPPSHAPGFPPDSLREKIRKWIDDGANNN